MRLKSIVVGLGVLAIGAVSYGAPTFAWDKSLTGTTSDGADICNAVGEDAAGNVYAVGSVYNGTFPNDFADIQITKYNAAGVVQWVRNYDRNGFDDVAYDAKVDAAGNVYVTGYSALDDTSTNTDVLILKVTTANVISFATTFVPPSNDVDEFGWSIAIDGSGNSYIAGEAGGVGIGFGLPYDAGLYRVNSAGVFQWRRVYTGTMGDYERLEEVVIASNGDAVATGYIVNANADALTVRVTSANVQVYADTYNTSYAGGTAINQNGANDVALDSAGNAYIVGATYKDTAPNDRQESFLRKLSAAGVVQWTSIYDGAATGITTANDVATDAAGVSYVVGETTVGGVNNSNYNQYIRRVTTAGVQSNVTTRDGGFGDFYSSVGFGGNGAIFAAGWSDLDGSAVPANKDGVLGEYAASNVAQVSMTTYNGAGNDWDMWTEMLIAGSDIYVSGLTYSTLFDANGLLVKYTTSVLVNPFSYTVVSGLNFGGNLGSLFFSDNLKVIVLCDNDDSIAQIDFNGTSPTATPSALALKCEVSATRTDLSLFTNMFKYTVNNYENVDFRLSTVFDTAYTAPATGTISSFVGPGNALKSQIVAIPNQELLSGDGWTVSVDRWQWEVQ